MGKEIKMLLLGTGESGKSTVMKQMVCLGFPPYCLHELTPRLRLTDFDAPRRVRRTRTRDVH